MRKNVNNIRRHLTPLTSERIVYIKEFVTFINLIKIYAWEKAIKSNIDRLRTEEIGWIRKLIFATLKTGDILNATSLLAIILTYFILA